MTPPVENPPSKAAPGRTAPITAAGPSGAADGAAIELLVNDRLRAAAAGATLADLARDLGLEGRKGVAIAVNSAVVPRHEWPARRLAARDRVLVIRATQGG